MRNGILAALCAVVAACTSTVHLESPQGGSVSVDKWGEKWHAMPCTLTFYQSGRPTVWFQHPDGTERSHSLDARTRDAYFIDLPDRVVYDWGDQTGCIGIDFARDPFSNGAKKSKVGRDKGWQERFDAYLAERAKPKP